VQVVAVTAFRDSLTVQQCRLAGMDEVFLKPVRHQELKTFLKENDYLQE